MNWLVRLLRFVLFYGCLLWLRKLLRWFTFEQPQPTPRREFTSPSLLLSATELARRIHAQELSSVAVTQDHIQRIKDVHPRLNALVKDRFDEALEEARKADARVADFKAGRSNEKSLPPLLGVPCTIKECIGLRGMRQSSGLIHRQLAEAQENATTVDRLLSLGVIPLGQSNLSELCMWYESNNAVYGRTNNAYSTAHTCGGSSGGEGALVGAGCSPLGLGSDIGGSIRMPAMFNGVFGHKPTGGLVPSTGQYPIAKGTCRRMLVTGPICRRSEDLWLLLKTFAGPDSIDQSVLPFELGEPKDVRISDLVVYKLAAPSSFLLSDCRPEMLAAQQRACDHLAAKGARVCDLVLPELSKGFDFWSARMSTNPEQVPFDVLLGSHDGNQRPLKCGAEILKWFAGSRQYTLPAIGLGFIEHLVDLLPKSIVRRTVEEAEQLRLRLNSLLGQQAVIVFPGFPTTAPEHNAPLLSIFDVLYTAIWNALELPVTCAPMGLAPNGLPTSIQIIGSTGSDHRTIAVACSLEEGGVAHWEPGFSSF